MQAYRVSLSASMTRCERTVRVDDRARPPAGNRDAVGDVAQRVDHLAQRDDGVVQRIDRRLQRLQPGRQPVQRVGDIGQLSSGPFCAVSLSISPPSASSRSASPSSASTRSIRPSSASS